ncbi:MAG: GNAT family N-acetyltransferase [Planctomycetota bacterium]
MTSGDLEAVIAVVALTDEDDAEAAREYFEGAYGSPAGEDIEDRRRDFVAVDASGGVIGVGGVQEDDGEGDGVWWLSWWYVHPGRQGRGIGGALMERSLRWVRERKGRKVYVDVSSLEVYAKARRFYAAHGFVEEARLKDYYAEGEDMVLMARPTAGPRRSSGP